MSDNPGVAFELDPTLAADSILIADWPLCRVQLMDDARFAWLILVPRRPGLVELDDLQDADCVQLAHEIRRAMQVLRGVTQVDKLNVGALGNLVRQFHVHVVARRVGDAAWPGPVWGSGPALRYDSTARADMIARLRGAAART